MSFVRKHRAATVSAAVVAALVGTLLVYIVATNGYQSRHVNLNDGGIWVTSDKVGVFGRLNRPAAALDAAVFPPGGAQSSYHLDVFQQDAAVVVWDEGSGKLYPVDVADGKAIEDRGVPVQEGWQVAMGGGTVAVLDPRTNRVWATRVDTVNGVDSLSALDSSAKPVAKFPAVAADSDAPRGAALAVGSDGTVYAAITHGDTAIVHPRGDRFGPARFGRLDQPLQSVQVSAVGTHMVVYDPTAGQVYLPGGDVVTVRADRSGAIQRPSDSGNQVVLATQTQLLGVPLSGGGKAVSLFDGGSGAPAAPTWFGNCVHAAWAGNPGVYARACGGGLAKSLPLPHDGALVDPVFRINRGAIILNDLALGSVYDLATMQEVDDWSAVKPPPVVRRSKKSKNNDTSVATRDLPPKAAADRLGARPARTTVLHVLDNDSDPQGAILAVTRLTGLDDPHATVATAPDGQSVELTLPDRGNPSQVHFKYTVDDGKGQTADAAVTVEVRLPGANRTPVLRHGFQQQTFSVSAGGTLNLPVLDDWRDYDGDPLVISSATTTGGIVTDSPDGRLNYLAPASGGNQKITYRVSDGQGPTALAHIPITVLGPTSDKTAPPVAEPDIAHGQVGKPITIKPLANDLPGADPTNPNAELGIAGMIASPAGVRVDTDLKSGEVTVTASRHGTFVLTYTASYGNARYARASIRVDVANAPDTPQPPVAVPDTGVLYGQTGTTIDVLANDFDPAGGVLVVQHANADDPDQLQVAIVGSHWLRVAARKPALSPNPQVVHYRITDGESAPVTGALTLTQVPAPTVDTPLAVDDYVTVRSGDSALVPVLDNDIDPAGATLDLLDDVPNAPASGQLTVANAEGAARGAGAAFVADKEVRYVAPAVRTQTSATVTYVATNPSGERASGTLHVTITPPPSPRNPDQAPAAQPIESRSVSGDTIQIKIPTTGIDPDGDTANVSGITSAPTLGRIVSIGATSITYQSFPTKSGTDRFGYQVTDPYGKSSTSTISVGVGTPTDPQPPVAVDDTATAAPGTRVQVDVLANDILAPDDDVSVQSLRRSNPELPPGTKLIGQGGPIRVVAPTANGRTSVVLYSVTDGAGDPSVGSLTVHSQAGYLPPPLAVDVPATPKPNATTVSVDVLAHASDPQSLPLHVARVFDPRAVVSGATVRVPVLPRVQNVVFELANSEGATAAAVIHVPARGVGAPYAKAGALITIPHNGSRTVAIGDYVVDPAGKPVRLTTADRIVGAPATGLEVTSPDPTHLTLSGSNGYNGPAAVVFQVTDGRTLNDPNGQLALISVQVQVGPDTPVLRCPSAPIDIVEGGDPRALDIAALCHVWTADPANLSRLRYTASWQKQPKGVDVLGSGTHTIGLQAHGAAVPGDTGALHVGVAGTSAVADTLNVVVQKLGTASVAPIVINGFKAGTTATRDLRGYVSSPLADPHVTVVRVTQDDGMPARVRWSGSRVSITPGATSHGRMDFGLLVSDVADPARKDRQVAGTLTMNVLNVPDAPGRPQSGRTVLSQTVVLSWSTPPDNGAQIDRYRVEWPGGAQTCPASPCRITGLVNGRAYTFTVRAHNAVGYSKASAPLAPPAKPDKRPAAVANLTASNPQDHTLTLSWTPVNNGASAVRTYQVRWSNGGFKQVSGGVRSTPIGGLDNHNRYTFTVVAVNELGAGPPASTQGQSAGAPSTPSGVGVEYADAAGTTTRTVRVHWNAVDPNGPGPATYTVTRNGATICHTNGTSCTDTPATGKTYTYSVVAANSPGHKSGAGSARFEVAGTPDTVGAVSARHTGTDGQLQVSYTSPNPHGKQSTIHCSASPGGSCGSWAGGAPGSAGTHPVSGLAKDADVTITLWDCNKQNYCGAKRSAQAAHTDGPPHAPNVSCSLSGDTITWKWNKPSAVNGYAVHFKLSGAHSASSTTATSWSHKYPEDGASHTLTVTSVDSRGESGGSDSAACTDHAPPNPATVTIKMGPQTFSNCSFGCHYVWIYLSGFNPGSYTGTLSASPNGWDPPRSIPITVGSDGKGSYTRTGPSGEWYGGGGGSPAGMGTVKFVIGGHTGTCNANWKTGSPGC